jgi:hypothetical protein
MALVLKTPARRFWHYFGNPQSWFTPALPSRSGGNHAWDPRITVKKDNGKITGDEPKRIEIQTARQ